MRRRCDRDRRASLCFVVRRDGDRRDVDQREQEADEGAGHRRAAREEERRDEDVGDRRGSRYLAGELFTHDDEEGDGGDRATAHRASGSGVQATCASKERRAPRSTRREERDGQHAFGMISEEVLRDGAGDRRRDRAAERTRPDGEGGAARKATKWRVHDGSYGPDPRTP